MTAKCVDAPSVQMRLQFSLLNRSSTFKTHSSAKSNKINETARKPEDLVGHRVTCPQGLRSGLYMPPLAPLLRLFAKFCTVFQISSLTSITVFQISS